MGTFDQFLDSDQSWDEFQGTPALPGDSFDAFLDSDKPWDEFQAEPIYEELGLPVGEEGVIGPSIAKGLIGTAEMYARAGRTIGLDTTNIIERAKKTAEPFESEKEGYFWNSVTQGIESTVQSILGGAPAAVVGGAIGGPVGAVAGFAGGAGTLFSLAEYDRFLEEVEEAGLSREKFKSDAIISAIAEGGIEAATDLIGAKIFGIIGKKAASQGVKEAFKRLTGQTLKLGVVEVPGEMVTGAIQAEARKEFRKEAGLPEISAWEEAVASAGPAGVQTLLMGPLAGGVARARKADVEGIPSPPIDEIRTKFEKDEISTEDLEAIKDIWSDEPYTVSAIDEILKPKEPVAEPEVTPKKEPVLTQEEITELTKPIEPEPVVEPEPVTPKAEIAEMERREQEKLAKLEKPAKPTPTEAVEPTIEPEARVEVEPEAVEKAKEPWELSKDEFEGNQPAGERTRWINAKTSMAGVSSKATSARGKIKYQDVARKAAKEFDTAFEQRHKKIVEQAISEGKIESHPDYPELAKAIPKAEKPAEEIEVTTKGEKKEVSVDIPAKEAAELTPKEQKAYLIAEIDRAIDVAVKEYVEGNNLNPEAVEHIKENPEGWSIGSNLYTFHVPGDGEFSIQATKLFDFKKRVKSIFPGTMPKPYKLKKTGRIKPKKRRAYAENLYKKTILRNLDPKEIDPKEVDTYLKRATEENTIYSAEKSNEDVYTGFINYLLEQDLKPGTRKKLRRSFLEKDFEFEIKKDELARKKKELPDYEKDALDSEKEFEKIDSLRKKIDNKEITLKAAGIESKKALMEEWRQKENIMLSDNSLLSNLKREIAKLETETKEPPKPKGVAAKIISEAGEVDISAAVEKIAKRKAERKAKEEAVEKKRAFLEKHFPEKLHKTGREKLKKELKTEKPSDWKKELFGVKDKNLIDKAMEQIDDVRDNWQTRVFDRLHPIKDQLGEEAYMLHRIETGIEGVLATFMRHGIPKWDGKALTVDTNRKGFLTWYKSLGKDGEKLLYWIAAKRAEVLETEDRENWLTETERKKIFESIGDPEKGTWDELHKQFNEFNSGILDLAVNAGIINQGKREQWEQEFYIPFYRVFEDEQAREEYLHSPKSNKRDIDAQIRRLKGAEKKLGDPLENTIRNWMHLIHESMRNMARAEAYDSAERLGVKAVEKVDKKELVRVLGSKIQTRYAVKGAGAKRASSLFDSKEDANLFANELSVKYKKKYSISPRQTTVILFGQLKDNNILSFQREGERVYFRVNDAELFNALSNMKKDSFNNIAMKMFRLSKKALTYGATFGPGFRVANMIRDTLHTAIISKSFVPILDSAKGFVKSMREDEDFVKFAASGAAFGSSYVKADDAKVLSNFIKRTTKREGKGVASRILDTPKKLLDIWEKIGSASENAARVSLYTKRISEQKSHLEAAFEARDLLDFTMSGDAGVVQFLIQIVPFMNARMQGLYKLGRAAVQDPKSFALKGGLITLASMTLYAINKDKDEWKELEDWDKWTYYHFWIGDKHFRIPKPFEVGAIFSTAFESAAEVMSGEEEIGFFIDFMYHMGRDTFAMNPTPQLAKPLIEQWANKSFFTGRPIESERLKKKIPGERFDPWTSETLKLLGEKWGIPPKRAQALIEGYLSTVGTFGLGITDIMAYQLGDFPSKPKKQIDDYPLLGRFIKEAGPARNTKHATRFYETMREIDQLVGTINDYKKTGDLDKARKLRDRNKEKLALMPRMNSIRKSLSDINVQIRKVYNSKTLTPKEKRNKLNTLIQRKNDKTKRAYELMMRKQESRQRSPSTPAISYTKKPITLKEAYQIK